MSLVDDHTGVAAVTAADVEAFLFEEAALLDDWDLEGWLELFDDRAEYFVPTTDLPDGDPDRDQLLISDDRAQISARVKRLRSRNAHAENPRSRTRRLVTNVRIAGRTDDELRVTASFMVHRFKERRTATYIGQYRHVLVRRGDALRFLVRKAVLDVEALDAEGRISIIL
ncbi:MAG: aromatic-ring-hydroxylating dioxygenase subunit beta [Acidimicrobiia bacterium]